MWTSTVNLYQMIVKVFSTLVFGKFRQNHQMKTYFKYPHKVE
ncbi:hypothetical protein VFA_002632 [Vibrio furnissii CIP 102972]|nr:hypothetical protein VFA_002632 [Vibrio furnissii CIP 102972]